MSLASISLHLSILSVFTAGISTLVAPILALVSFSILLISKSRRVSVRLLIVLSAVLVHGLINIAIGNTHVSLFWGTYVASAIFFVTFYFIVRSHYSIREIFKVYMAYAVVVAAIGLVQAGCWQVGFSGCYDLSGIFPNTKVVPGALLGLRTSSLLPEPSHVAFSLGPAISASILQLILPRVKILAWSTVSVILAFAILSQSSTVYLLIVSTLFAALFLTKPSFFRPVMLVALVGVVTLLAIANPPAFLKPTYGKAQSLLLLASEGRKAATSATSTTYTLYANARLAIQHARDTAWLGGGIGSHQLYFDRHMNVESSVRRVRNKTSAGNLVLRLLSELGVPGLMLLGAIFYVGARRIMNSCSEDRIIIVAMLLGVFAFCIRNGSFGHYGIALYVAVVVWGRLSRVPFIRVGNARDGSAAAATGA